LAAHAAVDAAALAKKLLYGDRSTRMEAVQEFNKLPTEVQYRLVPDFMVAMSDPDPEVRKVAARILNAMGVKSTGQIPDAKAALPGPPPHRAGNDSWAEEKRVVAESHGKYADLEKMKSETGSGYDQMKEQVDLEKKGQVTLDASQLTKDLPASASPLGTVTTSLKDPDPWVRAQAARRLAMINPAPVEAIPDLIKMLSDKETESRRAAAAALGSFGPLARSALSPLNTALSDPDPAVRQIAAEALKQIQQPQ